ncbi:hypothetical protein [Mesorhizobium sp.]|uniref:hypothetical protein n=1 Tax=Mesorhizobium sp. TaxID=1871066 RepID=UPI000FD2A7F7|nr:hypothetical protein [Mesorhizobium sp.]RVC64484.1 hypothetical protein EN779_01720 [Mesorhizobium sp. M4B.F.Ca.ET.088.02.2.1]RWF28354.1 MAG: hypothetical protein EOS45_22725 [Mesorhizobium sp.]
MRTTCVFGLVLMQCGSALADGNSPTFGSVQNMVLKASISYQCGEPVAGKILCRFRDMTLSQPTNEETEKRIADGVASLLKAKPEEFNRCDEFAKTVTALKAGKPPLDANPAEFLESWNATPDEEKARTITMMDAGAKFCQTRDPASAEAFIRMGEEVNAATCQIGLVQYDREFTLNPSTQRWQATIQSADECGTIAYSEFYRSETAKDTPFWNYSTKAIVTNPTGKQWSGESCSKADQSEHRYTWNVTTMFASCKYVKMNP